MSMRVSYNIIKLLKYSVLGIFANIFEILLCLHAIILYAIQRCHINSTITSTTLGIICMPFSLFLFVILALILIPFLIYRKSVDLVLRYKYKNKYGGLINGTSAMWMAEKEEAKHILNIVYFLQSDKSGKELFLHFQDFFVNNIDFPFNNLIKKFMGYGFRIKNENSLYDLTAEFKLSDSEKSSKELFEKRIGKISNLPLPQNGECPLEVLFCVEPVTFHIEKNLYPVLCRVHHSIGDGTSFLNFLLNKFSDTVQETPNHLVTNKLQTLYKSKNDKNDFDVKSLIQFKDKFFAYCFELYRTMKNVKMYTFLPLSRPTSNSLNGPDLSGDKITVYHIEENPQYVNKIKSLKRRIQGSTFTDIMMTAVSASFDEYYKKHNNHNVPENIPVTFMVKYLKKNMNYKVSRNQNEIKFINDFSVVTLHLPIATENDLMCRLKDIKQESEKLRDSIDILMFYWQFKILADLLPVPLIKIIYKLNESTVSISNLPGIDTVYIIGAKVKDIVFWTPHVGNLGVGLSILTYDGRFQIGIYVDKVLIAEEEKARGIIDNIFKYIDILDQQVIYN